jgi:hypothetical protein
MSQIAHKQHPVITLRPRHRRLVALAAVVAVTAVAALLVLLFVGGGEDATPAPDTAAVPAETYNSANGIRYDGGPEEGVWLTRPGGGSDDVTSAPTPYGGPH